MGGENMRDKQEQYKILETIDKDVILDYVWDNYYDWVMSQRGERFYMDTYKEDRD